MPEAGGPPASAALTAAPCSAPRARWCRLLPPSHARACQEVGGGGWSCSCLCMLQQARACVWPAAALHLAPPPPHLLAQLLRCCCCCDRARPQRLLECDGSGAAARILSGGALHCSALLHDCKPITAYKACIQCLHVNALRWAAARLCRPSNAVPAATTAGTRRVTTQPPSQQACARSDGDVAVRALLGRVHVARCARHCAAQGCMHACAHADDAVVSNTHTSSTRDCTSQHSTQQHAPHTW